MALLRGFKSQAQRLCAEVREELGLTTLEPLDPWALAELWGLSVYTISEQAAWDCSQEAIEYYLKTKSDRFSAALIPIGHARVIVENDAHALVRRRANVTHEMAHVILEHDFDKVILNTDGCRAVESRLEDEAAWFAGELLIPFEAALRAAQSGASDGEVASAYNVSLALARMRMNVSGARKVAERARNRRS